MDRGPKKRYSGKRVKGDTLRYWTKLLEVFRSYGIIKPRNREKPRHGDNN